MRKWLEAGTEFSFFRNTRGTPTIRLAFETGNNLHWLMKDR